MARAEERSIAVLTYDKRGVGKSLKSGDKDYFYRAGMHDLVHDAVAAVKYLAGLPNIDKDRIIVLGHSEGAIILPEICGAVIEAGLSPIHGAIFWSGFGESLLDAMSLQRTKLCEEAQEATGLYGWLMRLFISKDKLEKQYRDLMEKVNAEDGPDIVSMYFGFTKQSAKWMREHAAYDSQGSLSRNMRCRCLAVTGQKDVQVRNDTCTETAAAALVPNAKSIEAHRPENMTHALRSIEGPSKISNVKSDYAKMGKLLLDEELLRITDDWLDRTLFEK